MRKTLINIAIVIGLMCLELNAKDTSESGYGEKIGKSIDRGVENTKKFGSKAYNNTKKTINKIGEKASETYYDVKKSIKESLEDDKDKK